MEGVANPFGARTMSITSRPTLCLATIGGLLAACAIAAPEPAKPVVEAVTAKETLALRGLHHNAVEIFIDRPGFGVRRLMMDLSDLVAGPESLADVNAAPKQADQQQPAPKADKKPSHYAVQDLLIERGSRFPTDDGQESWQVRKVQLVGVMKHAKPVVYLVDGNPKTRDEEPKAEKDIPTRELNAFEKAALGAINKGEALKAEKSGENMRLLAPIFAGKRCTACHNQGELLGGFSYELERVAYDPAKDGVRRPRGKVKD
jgi:hypothetical protein